MRNDAVRCICVVKVKSERNTFATDMARNYCFLFANNINEDHNVHVLCFAYLHIQMLYRPGPACGVDHFSYRSSHHTSFQLTLVLLFQNSALKTRATKVPWRLLPLL